MIQATLSQTLSNQLDQATYESVREKTATAAAAGAYAGMALWTLNQLTVQHKTAGDLAKGLAGVSLGLLTEP